ncbi:MAG: helix-turn-helix transcriptional regulator [Tissierellales bacterium]|jgi:ArsR family transcriptional regulator|nr:helix-turn-helix transcriptional regulator [Tissierellales bacterium]HCX03888.1 transcriptional regulator [Clostridiales bacterium]
MKKNDIDTCDTYCIHDDRVDEVRKRMPEDEKLYDLAEFFKVFGDSTRVKILYTLFKHEMCVCDIAAVLCISQSAVSHQLRSLKNARLVKSRRDGKIVYYSLDDDHVKTVFEQGFDHINHGMTDWRK